MIFKIKNDILGVLVRVQDIPGNCNALSFHGIWNKLVYIYHSVILFCGQRGSVRDIASTSENIFSAFVPR